jgi:transposase
MSALVGKAGQMSPLVGKVRQMSALFWKSRTKCRKKDLCNFFFKKKVNIADCWKRRQMSLFLEKQSQCHPFLE